MVFQEYYNLVSEFYDLSDPKTRDAIITVNEAGKEAVLEDLANKLYNNIRNKVTDIDFGSIPKSNGDITKVENYDQLLECLNNINGLVKEYNQKTDLVDTVYTAIGNIKKRTATFQKSFGLRIEFPMMVYNTMVLSIISSISLLINTCIEYIKEPDNSFTVAFDKTQYVRSKDHVLFKSLSDFNKSCMKEDMDKALNVCIKSNLTQVKEGYDECPDGYVWLQEFGAISGLLGIIAAVGVAFPLILYCIRNTVYYLFSMRQKLSDYFAVQADFLQMNAENLKYRDKYKNNEEERKRVYDNQMKWVKRFREWSNRFMIKDKQAQKDAESESKQDDRENSKYPKDTDNGNGDGGLF